MSDEPFRDNEPAGEAEDRLFAALNARHRRDLRDVMLFAGEARPAEDAETFSEAIDAIAEGIAVWDSEARLLRFNRRLPELFGLRSGLLQTGIAATEFVYLLIAENVVNMRPDEAGRWVETHLAANLRASRKQEVRLRDGSWLSFDWRQLPSGGYVSVFSDVTARRRALSRLQHAELKYRQIFDNVEEGVIQVTPGGRLLAVNRAGAAIFGFTGPDEMLAQVSDSAQQLYVQPARRAEMLDYLQRYGFVNDFRSQMRRRDGTVIWVAKTLRLVADESGGMAVIEGMFRDVSAQRRAEETLLKAKDQAETANRAKSEFLANMSHELRTPLNAILGFSQILSTELLGPLGNAKYMEYCRDILASGQHLLALINDILDTAKVEAGKMVLDEEWFDLDCEIDAALLLVRERAVQNRQVLEKTMPENFPYLWGDPRRLRQVLINLLSNAVKFTPMGGRVSVDVSLGAEGLQIAVSDTGIGIAPENIDRVLLPFGQVANALSRPHDGTGLGLSLSRRLVELHGGRLTVESEVGVGTTVTVSLPADRCRADASTADGEHQFAEHLPLRQPEQGLVGLLERQDAADQGAANAAD